MKRDLNLVRDILLAMEAEPEDWQQLSIVGHDRLEVGFHVHLMCEGGLITGTDVTTQQDPCRTALPGSITWQGYEFLEAARDDSTWRAAVTIAAKAGNVSFRVIWEALDRISLEKLGGS